MSSIGFPIMWPTENIPDGYIVYDGSALEIALYPELYAVLGYAYSATQTPDHFNVPDYRGRIPRGVDNGRGADPDVVTRAARPDGAAGVGVAGTTQESQLKRHQHIYYNGSDNTSGTVSVRGTNSATAFNTSTEGGAYTRGNNIAMTYIARYR